MNDDDDDDDDENSISIESEGDVDNEIDDEELYNHRNNTNYDTNLSTGNVQGLHSQSISKQSIGSARSTSVDSRGSVRSPSTNSRNSKGRNRRGTQGFGRMPLTPK